MAISKAPLDQIVDLAQAPTAITFDTVSHKILHIVVDDHDRKRVIIEFASPFVTQQVYDSLKGISAAMVVNVMAQCSNYPSLHDIYGQMFEVVCHPLLCSGKQFMVKSLEDEDNSTETLDLRHCETVKFMDFNSVVT